MRTFVSVVTISFLASTLAWAAVLGPRPPRPDMSVCAQDNKDPWTCTFDCGGGATAECHASGTSHSLCRFADGSLHGYSGNVCFPSPF